MRNLIVYLLLVASAFAQAADGDSNRHLESRLVRTQVSSMRPDCIHPIYKEYIPRISETQGGCYIDQYGNRICPNQNPSLPRFVPRQQPQQHNFVYARSNPAVVRISNQRQTERTLGSGTLIASDLILTCGHIFREYQGDITCYFPNGKSVTAEVLAIDNASDLSLLRIHPVDIIPVQIANSDALRGDRVESSGYGPDGRYAINSGRVIGYFSLTDGQRNVLEITGAARQGDSGGPMFNSNGELTGVLFGTDGKCVDGTCCYTIKRFIQRFRDRISGNRSPPKKVPAETEQPTLAPVPGSVTPDDSDCEKRVKQLREELEVVNQKLLESETNRRQLEAELNGQITTLRTEAETHQSMVDRLENRIQTTEKENTSLLDKIREAHKRIVEITGRGPQTIEVKVPGPERVVKEYIERKVETKVADPFWKWISGISIAAGVPSLIAVPVLWVTRRRLKKRLSTVINNKIRKGQGTSAAESKTTTIRSENNTFNTTIRVGLESKVKSLEAELVSLRLQLSESEQTIIRLKEINQPIDRPLPIPLDSAVEDALRNRIKQLEAELAEANQIIMKLKEINIPVADNTVNKTENIFVDRPRPELEAEAYREAIRRLSPQYAYRTMLFSYAVELIEGVKAQLWQTDKKLGSATQARPGWKVE